MRIHEVISIAAAQIKSSTPKLDAELLLAHLLKKDRSFLYTHADDTIENKIIKKFNSLLVRRLGGEPIAYIMGFQDFWNVRLKVNENTLIPRPETELLVEKCLELIGEKENQAVLDLGTGSGAIAIALAKEKPGWKITAIDNSENALKIARENAELNNVKNIEFLQSDWFSAISDIKFDVIVSNPPYVEENHICLTEGDVRFEPISALISGVDGLEAIRKIIQQAKLFLNKGGYLLLEHGYNQQRAIIELLRKEGYKNNYAIVDLSKIDRVVIARE